MRKMKYFKSSSKAELNISYRLQTLGNDRNPIEYLRPLSRVRPGGISPIKQDLYICAHCAHVYYIRIIIFAPTEPTVPRHILSPPINIQGIIARSLYLRPLSRV